MDKRAFGGQPLKLLDCEKKQKYREKTSTSSERTYKLHIDVNTQGALETRT